MWYEVLNLQIASLVPFGARVQTLVAMTATPGAKTRAASTMIWQTLACGEELFR